MNASRLITLIVLLAASSPARALADDHCVRAGAAGGADCGAGWDSACPELPASLVRGDTYYVADGEYVAYEFDDEADGTQVITVRKATPADHGPAAGWSDDYGDGQAVWRSAPGTAPWSFTAPYYVLDGQVGEHDGADPGWPSGDATPHGFKLLVGLEDVLASAGTLPCAQVYRRADGPDGREIIFEHVEMEQGGQDIPEPACQRSVNLYIIGESGLEIENLAVRDCYLHDVTSTPVLMAHVHGITFDHGYFARRGHWREGETHCHGQAFSIHPSVTDLTIRHSVFEDIEGTGIITFGLTDGGVYTNTAIHGNVFFTNDADRYRISGVINDTNSPAFDGLHVYNNTVAHYSSAGNYVLFMSIASTSVSNAAVRNNLLYDLGSLNEGFLFDGDIDHDHDCCFSHAGTCTAGFGDGTKMTDEPSGTILAEDPLIDAGGRNFHPLREACPGIALDAAYAIDPDGLTRGADGVWDAGAYEYPGPAVTCADLGGECCGAGMDCEGGFFQACADCPGRCCIDGACAAPTCESSGHACCDRCSDPSAGVPDLDETCDGQVCCTECSSGGPAHGGCSCRAAPPSGGSPALVIFALLALWYRGRRR